MFRHYDDPIENVFLFYLPFLTFLPAYELFKEEKESNVPVVYMLLSILNAGFAAVLFLLFLGGNGGLGTLILFLTMYAIHLYVYTSSRKRLKRVRAVKFIEDSGIYDDLEPDPLPEMPTHQNTEQGGKRANSIPVDVEMPYDFQKRKPSSPAPKGNWREDFFPEEVEPPAPEPVFETDQAPETVEAPPEIRGTNSENDPFAYQKEWKEKHQKLSPKDNKNDKYSRKPKY